MQSNEPGGAPAVGASFFARAVPPTPGVPDATRPTVPGAVRAARPPGRAPTRFDTRLLPLPHPARRLGGVHGGRRSLARDAAWRLRHAPDDASRPGDQCGDLSRRQDDRLLSDL